MSEGVTVQIPRTFIVTNVVSLLAAIVAGTLILSGYAGRIGTLEVKQAQMAPMVYVDAKLEVIETRREYDKQVISDLKEFMKETRVWQGEINTTLAKLGS